MSDGLPLRQTARIERSEDWGRWMLKGDTLYFPVISIVTHMLVLDVRCFYCPSPAEASNDPPPLLFPCGLGGRHRAGILPSGMGRGGSGCSASPEPVMSQSFFRPMLTLDALRATRWSHV